MAREGPNFSVQQYNHELECRKALKEIDRILKLDSGEKVSNEEKLCKLSSVLQQQVAGTQGAGLTGGQQQESLWVEMFISNSQAFSKTSTTPVKDADYYHSGYPLSHKTIGWNGHGDLALAWSKNPPEGLQRTVFHASVAIALTVNPSKRKWRGLQHGLYLIPLSYIQTNIQLSSNNKTDSLIKSEQVIGALQYCAGIGLCRAINYDHSWGHNLRLTIWSAGLRAIQPA